MATSSWFLLSVGLVFFLGILLGELARKLRLPPLVGYLLAGICLGTGGGGVLSPTLLEISSPLRQLALIIILLKAGLALDWRRLCQVGRPALWMACIPACFELGAVTLLAPLFFPLTLLEAALLGGVLAAVSPAVVVPRMVKFIEKGVGSAHKVPEIVLAGASLDDVFVIALFTALLSMVEGEGVVLSALWEVPFSILLGMIVGVGLGKVLKTLHCFQGLKPQIKILLLLSLSVLLVAGGEEIPLPYAPLLSVMTLGMTLRSPATEEVSHGLNGLWLGGEVLLFVLVGAEIQVEYAQLAGVSGVVLVLLALIPRSVGVLIATSGTELHPRERLFCVVSYLPKATVQAAIGGMPLALGLDCGPLILTVAVVAILVTAPLGAYLIDRYGEGLCHNEN